VTHFDVLGLGNNVVVMLYGQMTPNQRQRQLSRKQDQDKLLAYSIAVASLVQCGVAPKEH
jgi:hypothetical protein